MALPEVPADELARRLHIVYPDGPLDPQLEMAVAVAAAMLTPLVDEALATATPALWFEAVVGLAVKVWDTAAKGVVGMDAVGGFDFPAATATAGLPNSVAALWHPLTLTGGNVIA